eukprot:COSAG02_NODE_2412_length_8920_cov_2.506178_2_plen_180_part_00
MEGMTQNIIVKTIGERWRALQNDPESRAVWTRMEEEEKQRYARDLAASGGDFLHMLSILILIYKMHAQKSCAGVSLKTQILCARCQRRPSGAAAAAAAAAAAGALDSGALGRLVVESGVGWLMGEKSAGARVRDRESRKRWRVDEKRPSRPLCAMPVSPLAADILCEMLITPAVERGRV